MRSSKRRSFVVLLMFLFCSAPLAADVGDQYFSALALLRAGEPAKAAQAFASLLKSHGAAMTTQQKSSIVARGKAASRASTLDAARAKAHVDAAAGLCRRASSMVGDENRQAELRQFLQQALNHLEAGAGAGNSDPRYHYLVGFSLLYLDKATQAKEPIERAVARLPRMVECHTLHAALCRSLNDTRGEMLALRRALQLQPDNAELNYRYAKGLLEMGGQEQLAFAAAKRGVGKSRERAFDLAAKFHDARYRNELESIGTELAIDAKRLATFGTTEAQVMLHKGSGSKGLSVNGPRPGGGGDRPSGGGHGGGPAEP